MKKEFDLVIFGDSLCTDFHVTTAIPTMIRAKRSTNKGGWPRYLNLKTKCYTTVSGYIHPNPPSIRLRSKVLLGAKSLHQKIKGYLKTFKQHPGGYFIWIGHNNLDWFADTENSDKNIDDYLTFYAKEMAVKTIETVSLLKTLPRPISKTPIIVSGLVNFKDFLDLRNKIMSSKHDFHYAHKTNDIFPSFKLENQKNLLILLNNYNNELEKIILAGKSSFSEKNYDLIYSNRMVSIPIKAPRILNKNDAWHLSSFGQKYFADYIGTHLEEILTK